MSLTPLLYCVYTKHPVHMKVYKSQLVTMSHKFKPREFKMKSSTVRIKTTFIGHRQVTVLVFLASGS